MKKFLLFTLTGFLSIGSYAGKNLPGINHTQNVFTDSLQMDQFTLENIVSQITDVMGLQDNFEVKSADVLNIEASISHHKRMILFNPVFMDWVNKAAGNKWAAFALVAHEMGHHVNGHTLSRGGSQPALELEADEFAGLVLHRLGATLQQAQEVMYLISTNRASKTHPARQDRLSAIQNGWDRG
jgi:hypothetical protein